MSKFEESKIQEAIVRTFNKLTQLNQFNQVCVLYSNRNENKGIISGTRFKKQGRISGVPDLTLLYDGKVAYIEVKSLKAHKTSKGVDTKSRGMSEEQIKFHDKYIVPMGIKFAVVSSVADFESFIRFLRK